MVLLLPVLLEGPARRLKYLDVERIAHDLAVDLAELLADGHAHQQPALLVQIAHPMHRLAEVSLGDGRESFALRRNIQKILFRVKN